MLVFCILLQICIASICMVALSWKKPEEELRVWSLEPRAFILVTLVYTIPLPIAFLSGTEGGNLSEDLDLFAPWLAPALLYVSIFLVVFTFTYLKLKGERGDSCWSKPNSHEVTDFKIIWCLAMAVCIFQLKVLSSEVGGIFQLVMAGYKVTELFVGQGHLAVAFEWMMALAILLLCFGIVSGKDSAKHAGIAMLAILALVFAIMGRRGVLAAMFLATIYVSIEVGWIKRIGILILPALLAFIGLNWLGLVRGESYDDLSALSSVLLERTTDLSDSSELLTGLFYTLTQGNFVVSFETLPQLMRKLSDLSDFWFGGSLPRSLLLFLPSTLFPDRPLPLANWYMNEFYGGSAGLNEGRQFFFLGEAYLNFWWFGCVIWGLLIGWIFHKFSRPASGEIGYLSLATRALFFGSLLNIQASDTVGFLIVFVKGYGFFPIILYAAHRLRQASASRE